MTTQLESARKGNLTSEMKAIAAQEGLDEIFVLDYVAIGEIGIPCTPNRKHQKIVGIGKGLCTNENASIGADSSARFGADLACDIAPAEHLALPDDQDVREGERTTCLAVRIGDLCKYPNRHDNEKQAALARRDMCWEDLSQYLLFPDTARAPEEKQTCTMCKDFCEMKKGMEIFQTEYQRKGVDYVIT
jgi:thiamine biosynthesis protein ThiC